MTGTVLGNRYEIMEVLGSGGMAMVYLARCRYLNRLVAIKVLKDEFRADAEFLKRFDAEAQAAASLTHPNIVQIFDVGREESIRYIVMEYVDGSTLKDRIRDKGAIPWRQAIDMAIQICGAIGKAHQKNIVHRDIKPQNILLTADGIPKVADFGIARASTAETATMKVEPVASVHYSSPEQVRGGYTDTTTDIYSMGVTLYEMLSGKVPFDGETTVAIAMKQIHDPLPDPMFTNPEIPEALALIVGHAMEKSKSDRYATIEEMISDLDQVRGMTEAQGVALPYHRRHTGSDETPRQAAAGETRQAGNGETQRVPGLGTALAARSGAADPSLLVGRESGSNLPQDAPHSHSRPYDGERELPRRTMKGAGILIPIAYVLLIGILIYMVISFTRWVSGGTETTPTTIVTEAQDEVVIGEYTGRTIDEVNAEVEANGIRPVSILYVFSDTVEKDVVISQTPLSGSKLKVDGMTVLEITVSKGKDLVALPEVEGQDHNEMRFKLQDEMGMVVTEKSEYSDRVSSGKAIRTEPASGAELARGAEVTLFWSLGPEKKQVLVPELKDLSREKAEELILANGLVLSKVLPEATDLTGAKVVSQSPKAGETVLEGSKVEITLEKPTEPTANPGDGGTQQAVTNVTLFVELPAGKETQETVRVLVVLRDIESETDMVRFDADVPVVEFPRAVIVPIPDGGGVTTKIFVDGELVQEKNY